MAPVVLRAAQADRLNQVPVLPTRVSLPSPGRPNFILTLPLPCVPSGCPTAGFLRVAFLCLLLPALAAAQAAVGTITGRILNPAPEE